MSEERSNLEIELLNSKEALKEILGMLIVLAFVVLLLCL